jgi:Zn-dependent M28 family amino/carboxypeptidase
MKLTFLSMLVFASFSLFAQSEITEAEIKNHIEFLAHPKNKGRYPGTKESEKVVRYIRKDFKKSGVLPLSSSYFQEFEARLRVKKGVQDTPKVKTVNVVGIIPGSDLVLNKEFIVVGAHYDHLGMGGPSSKKPDTTAIHHGADDNASGTAALMEIGEKLASNKKLLKRSIILIAFGAEEQGLLGSGYFTENPLVPLSAIKLMVNMDMVGRLNAEKQIYMGGAGTFPGGMELMRKLGPQFGLNPVVHAGEVGGSDHVSFYRKGISVIGLHTGGHPQYHVPEDVAGLINIPGEKMVCDYIYEAVKTLASSDEPLYFIDQK